MRYAVLGARGQLGRELGSSLPGEVFAWTRDQADLTQSGMLQSALERTEPDVVINCAAYNFVDKAEAEPEAAFAVNTWGVRALAAACGKRNCTLVHFSTDHVFGLDASHRQPWSEDAAPGPVSVYGASKLTGEYFVRALCPRHFVIRTCGLYGLWGSGGKGGNFVEKILRMASEGKPLRVVNDQLCTPTSAAALATAVVRLIVTAPFGRYHLTCSGECSWYEFAAAICKGAGLAPQLEAISSAALSAPARRPAYSVLANLAAQKAGLPPLPSWQDALAAYLHARNDTRQDAVPPQ